MIFTAPIAGLGLVLAPTVDAPALTVIEPPVITTPATDTPPPASETATPAAEPATTPQPDAATEVAAVKDEAANPTPLGTCHVCGPVYATRDPLIGMNRVFYAINQPIDRFIFRPPAMLYKTVVPRPAREGVRNALSNIYSPVTFFNDLVQLRPKHALTTLGRFVINTTLGIGGLFDIAKRKPFRLQPHTNSFANSLALLGMTSGPYLYLPFIGPSSFRDMLGAGGDTFAQPLLVNRVYSRQERTVGSPMRTRKVSSFSSNLSLSTFGVVLTTLSALDRRAEADAELKALKASAVDPYVALREAYLQSREAEIAALKVKDGQAAPVAAFDDPLADPAAAQPAPTPEKK